MEEERRKMIGELAKEAAGEMAKKAGETTKNFNPDTKAEISKPENADSKFEFDPDTKAEVSKHDTTDSWQTETEKQESKEADETKKIRCRNEYLEGSEHPETGVPFERKTVENENGEKLEGVFPQFESEYDVQLSEENLQTSDMEQFTECNEKLKEAVETDPDLVSKFSDEQLEQIKNGDTPDGYTWHHSEDKGKMQLVDSDVHAKTGHTGGKSIWGGGSSNR